MTYTLYDRLDDTSVGISKEHAERVIKRAELYSGPYGAMGTDVDQVIYVGETVAAIRHRGQWLDIPAHQAPFVAAELAERYYDPLPAREPVEIDICIIEAGEDYLQRLDAFTATLRGTERQMVEQAQELVAARGCRVMANSEGGCNGYVGVTGSSDYIAVTVYPKLF